MTILISVDLTQMKKFPSFMFFLSLVIKLPKKVSTVHIDLRFLRIQSISRHK